MSLAYMQGMLYPRSSAQSGDTGGDDEGENTDGGGFETSDDPLAMATALMPASMGITFCVSRETEFEIVVEGALYHKVDGVGEVENDLPDRDSDENAAGKGDKSNSSECWKRHPIEPSRLPLKAGESLAEPKKCLAEMASISILPRKLPDDRWLMTVSLSNDNEAGRPDPSKTIYQAKLSVVPKSGTIAPYPTGEYLPPSEEERELQVIYGTHEVYAVGHGVSADWELDAAGNCIRVCTQGMPIAHVWRPRFDQLIIREGEAPFADTEIFNLSFLASGKAGRRVLGERLKKFVAFYEEWIGAQEDIDVPTRLQVDADRILSRCRRSAARMHEGVVLLSQDEEVFKAFTLANKAMLMSMSHFARASGAARNDGKQGPFELGEAETGEIDYLSNTKPSWRAFQLAFILQLLPSLCDGQHEDRDAVDVIWFPTGGGKTEAYLLAAALELIRRRLVAGDAGGGTSVINRYTYRFLTSDQFQRTAGMICALEKLRRDLAIEGDRSLGETEFSIGLFVGGEVSPNRITDSYGSGAYQWCLELYDAKQPRADNPFPIESCPCCGTLLVPGVERRLPDGQIDETYFGFLASQRDFVIRCPEEDCDFHEGIPAYIVDEQILESPPSFLLGTIDKFAMIPWKENGGRILGVGTTNHPPSLIIQDELHLISGPLGTLAGIYEAAFETLMRSGSGASPKVIAATATIRNAGAQCRRIYGREGVVFPSPGLSANDSFFSSMDVGNTDRSRLYVGLMGQGLRSTVAVSWAMAAILQAVQELEKDDRLTAKELDAYWSLVAYHNSKRELGRIANATRDEIPARLKVYATAEDVERSTDFHVLELKAHAETPIPVARQLLGQRHDPPESPAIDIVPCTNIISVGVDINRLGLMLVNGQPKLTAEYIQASSRVGRGDVPGLVFTCFSPSKPRDRSHYEAFRTFHERFYSYVEPTSVTPGSIPAIERALHAALVTAIRHGTSYKSNAGASKFEPSDKRVADIIDILLSRLQAAYDAPEDREIRDRLAKKLNHRIEQWLEWTKVHKDLRYSASRGQQQAALLRRFEDKLIDGVGWHTLQSMRHVDSEIKLKA
ncbi:DEAD/DEAH box helicase [Actibacterium pelagium]|nr:DEAD/DEAH box helicase [Actibacterium pelagium]